MNASKLEIFDWIREFTFGQEIILKLSNPFREEFLVDYWTATFDPNYGPCFTFDPSKHNISLQPSNYKTPGGRVELWETQIEFSFQWFQSMYESRSARYYLSIHNGMEDRFDRLLRQPHHEIEINHNYNIKLSKSKFESLDQEGSKCSDDPLYGPQRLMINKVRSTH